MGRKIFSDSKLFSDGDLIRWLCVCVFAVSKIDMQFEIFSPYRPDISGSFSKYENLCRNRLYLFFLHALDETMHINNVEKAAQSTHTHFHPQSKIKHHRIKQSVTERINK